MPEKFISGWPEGTKEIKRSDGKKEIILPEPTDLNEHSREELVRGSRMNQAAKETIVGGKPEGPVGPQFSVDRGTDKPSIWDGEARRKVNSRQEVIATQRKQERIFREKQKKVGAENYDRLFEK